MFHKKFFSNISRYSQEKTCVGVSFLIKLQAISPVTLLKHGFKRDSKTDICCDYRETPNLKNICEQLHWKFFCKNIFQIRTCMNECSECSPVVWKVAQISQDWTKVSPIISTRGGEKIFNAYIRWKTFHAKLDKKQKIFFHTPVSENFNIKHLWWSKADLSKEKIFWGILYEFQ